MVRLSAWLLIAAGCSRGDSATVGPRTDYTAVVEVLERSIRHEMTDKGLPAVSIGLVDGDDVVWATGFGFANPEDSTPATATTLYRVGSIAKLVTAIGVMQLVERGELELDAPVQQYLPDFRPPNPFEKPVTVRQILSHRAGIVRESPVGSYFDSSRTSLAEAVASLNQTALVYSPGDRTKYSDAGMAVAGLLIERQRRQPFVGAVQGSVLAPLRLSHTTFTPDLSLDRSLARGLSWSYDGRTATAPRFEMGVAPASGLYSTVTDLARLISVLVGSGAGGRGQLLQAETVSRMWTVASGDTAAGREFGLGFRVSRRDGTRRIGHGSAFGGHSTDLVLSPEDRLGAVVITTRDAANGVTARIADAALTLMQAVKGGQPLPRLVTTAPLQPELAKRLDGLYAGSADRRIGGSAGRGAGEPAGRRVVELEERNGRLFYHEVGDEVWLELKTLGDTLVTDDRLGFGERILPRGTRLVVGTDTLTRVSAPRPADIPGRWLGLIGEYGPDFNTTYVREESGRLHILVHSFFDYPLTEESPDVYRFPDYGLYHGERVRFSRGGNGRGTAVSVGEVVLARRAVGPEDGSTFKITPVRPAQELVAEALAATPPRETGDLLKPDLVEIVKLDGTIKLDMRYATTNNFVSTAFYKEGRAFLQRPAAEALVRAHRRLKQHGYGLLIHDSYRPWYVTKMFWDATPEDKKVFVANPANGSRHNRGCAIDLTLYDLRTGRPIEMVSGYDEFSDRAYPDYPGGTSLQRWHRKLLRRAMEAEGFTVFSAEWWHFDYKDWRKYPIMNLRFEQVDG